jgi:hypothetical protein
VFVKDSNSNHLIIIFLRQWFQSGRRKDRPAQIWKNSLIGIQESCKANAVISLSWV